jgi:nitrogen regulatory protein P-II 1
VIQEPLARAGAELRRVDVLHLVTAVVKPHKLDAIEEALQGAGVQGMTVTEVKGFGRQGGHTETYRGAEYQIDFLHRLGRDADADEDDLLVPKVKVEVLCATEGADKITATIAEAARTNKIGDGQIWVTAIDRAVRIRTSEIGDDAI